MVRVCPECGRRYEMTVAHCPEDGSPTLVYSQEDDLVGQTIDGRFTVRELIGKGGMGAVYRAHQHSMDRDVALKVLRRDMASDEAAVKRFFREARAASKLTSPHTITVFDFGQTDKGLLYIAMEMLRGRSLARMLSDERAPMDWRRAARIVDQVLDSLVEAHSVGVLHRDLKPDNIFVLEGAGRQDFVKVLDFGIAKIQGSSATTNLTGTGMTFGTPTYMSPEQAQAKQLDSRSDLYSLGVMLFEMLAGKPPFEGETPLALMLQKVQEQPPTVFHVNPEVRIPAPLDDLITRMLATKPADRPADATAVKTLLAAATAADAGLVQMGPVVVREGTTQKFAASRVPDLAGDAGLETARPEVFPPDKARLPWAWIAGGIAAGVVGIAAALLVMSGGGATTEPASATPAPAAVPAPAAAPATATTPVPAPAPAAPAPTPAAPAPVAVPAVAPAPAAPSPAPAVQPQPRKAGTAAKAPAKAPPPAEPEDDIGRLLKKGSGKTEDEFLLKKAGGR